ncbi:MAG: M50 family metallopeptidase [Gemmatimonadota bacterium]
MSRKRDLSKRSRTKRSGSKRNRAAFLGGFLALLAGLLLFWNTVWLYPLQLFVVFLHEISHALMALATGGRVDAIVLDPRLGGACYCPGGNAFLTLSAGYLGSLLWGGLFLEVARKWGRHAVQVNSLIGGTTMVLTLLYFRSPFSVAFGLLAGVGFLLASRKLAPRGNAALLTVVGVTSCLYAILDMKADILDRPHLPSDAQMLAELTGVPTVVWGLVWMALGTGVALWLFLRAWQRP